MNRRLTEIEPESVDQGDLIRVVFPELEGVSREATATVHRRVDDGPARTLYTEQGGHILTWYRGDRRNFRVYLLARAPQGQVELPIFEHVAERIAG